MYKRNVQTTNPDLDPRAGARTIGSVLAGSDLLTLSDGEFDVTYLTKYPYRRQLDECCGRAVSELADEPYDGRPSCARVMGRAMELLRKTYDLNVPRGWVPILRKLRAIESPSRSHPRTAQQSRQGRSADIPVVLPQEILTDPFSALHAMITGPRLRGFVEAREDLKNRFVELAEQVGVPQSWTEALCFLEFLTDQLDEVPEPLSESLVELREEVSRYRCPLARPFEQRIERLRSERCTIP